MPHRISGVIRWSLGLVAGTLVSIGAARAESGAPIDPTHDRADTDPPIVLVLPTESVDLEESLEIGVEIFDPSGPGRAIVWARGEHDAEFREIAMHPRGESVLVAKLPSWPTRGAFVAFYVEAYDRSGNGPAFGAGPRAPFVVRFEPGTGTGTGTASTGRRVIQAGVISTFLLGVALFLLRRPNRTNDEDAQKRVIVDLNRLARPATQAPGIDRNAQSPDERDFWERTLTPLLELRGSARDRALRTMAARPHYHPTLGKRFYDRRVLVEQLEALRYERSHGEPDSLSDDPVRLEPLPGAVSLDDASLGRRPPGQAGATLAELVVVIGLVGLGLGVAATSLQSVEAPLRSSGEMVDGLLGYSRSRAVSSTTPHRVRPISPTTLVVESGASCTAGPWVVDPEARLELADGVAFADTSWAACFTSRGVTRQNLVVTLQHHELGSQQLEILLGGSVKWLP